LLVQYRTDADEKVDSERMEAVAGKQTGHKVEPRFQKCLGVVTHVPHWSGTDGTPWAYEPYVRELRLWADLFTRVEILAPFAEGPMQGNQAPYERPNVVWRPFSYSLSYDPWSPLRRLTQVPALALQIDRLIADCDLIHLRSPGHPALVGQLLVRLRQKFSIAKWAGLFDSFPGERLPSRFERRLVRWCSDRHPVLIYGPTNHPNMIPFMPALMTDRELVRARHLSGGKNWSPPWRLLSVGRLLAVKNFETAIRGLGELHERRPDLEWEYTLIGDGPEASALRELAVHCGIAERVHFTGALPFDEVQKYYASAQLVIMPGVMEGWPKIIAEAWAHRAVPVAAAAGLVPWILQGADYGVPFRPTPRGLADALTTLMGDEMRLKALLGRCATRSNDLSLERFKEQLEEVLVARCGLD
jgi:glycosyltransferase involved in cell wall biosynthesis